MSSAPESEIITRYLNSVLEFKLKHVDESSEHYEELRAQAVEETNELREFADSLDDKERRALEIAIEHLEDSFDVEKCLLFGSRKK
jgi:uncharacterized protein (UPF0371 family)